MQKVHAVSTRVPRCFAFVKITARPVIARHWALFRFCIKGTDVYDHGRSILSYFDVNYLQNVWPFFVGACFETKNARLLQ